MPSVDPTRIAGNIGALNALNSLSYINNQLAISQMRLATGKRINEAQDDPAGMIQAISFDARRVAQQTVLNAIGNAKNVLATAEGGIRKINEILVKMKGKLLEAKGSTQGVEQVRAIQDQLNAYSQEIDAIVGQTKWNDIYLIGTSGSSGGLGAVTVTSTGSSAVSGSAGVMNFLTDADTGGMTSFTLSQGYGAYGVDSSGSASSTNGLNLFTAAGSATSGFMLVTSSSASGVNSVASTSSGGMINSVNIDSALTTIDNALSRVKLGIGQVGGFMARLTFKEDALTTNWINTESAYNRIMNANMAEEQVNASKFLILQQTATAMLAQANTAPNFLLSLFR